jgi:hypothetical protein
MKTLKEELADLTDIDGAQDSLARCLGLLGPQTRFNVEAKHVYWTNNPVGQTLFNLLDRLAEIGVLEWSADGNYRVRWNPVFRGSWER